MNKYVAKFLPPILGTYYNVLSYFSPRSAGIKAFYTFCTIRKGWVLPEQEEFLNAAKKEMLTAGTHSVQVYHWQGNGPTILLLHGWESNVFRWRKLISAFKGTDFNIIAFDAPGHGNSPGKIMNLPIYSKCALAAIKTYAPTYIIGHSVGGMCALYTLNHNPNDQVEKIVTLGSPNEFYEIVDGYQKLLGFNSRVYSALDDYIHERYNTRIREFRSVDYVKNLSQSGLLVHDKEDMIVPFHASEQVHNAWKNSMLMPTEGLGHSLHQDDVNEAVVDFINS